MFYTVLLLRGIFRIAREVASFLFSPNATIFSLLFMKNETELKNDIAETFQRKYSLISGAQNVIPFLVKSATLVKHVITWVPLLLQNSCESIVVRAFFVARAIVRDK